MPIPNPRHCPEEIARRGDKIYERDFRSWLEPDYLGQIVTIDMETHNHAATVTTPEATRDK